MKLPQQMTLRDRYAAEFGRCAQNAMESKIAALGTTLRAGKVAPRANARRWASAARTYYKLMIVC